MDEQSLKALESDVKDCVACLNQLDKYKKSMLSDNALMGKFPVAKEDSETLSQRGLCVRSSNSLFPHYESSIATARKNYKEAIDGFYLESTKFACELITSFHDHQFHNTINALSLIVQEVANYQKEPANQEKLNQLIIAAKEFYKQVDNADSLSNWCRKIIGNALIMLGSFIPSLKEYGQKILKPQFIQTKDALKKLLDEASTAIEVSSNDLVIFQSPQ